MDTEKKEKEQIVRSAKADDYKTVFVHQFYGGNREDHFELIVESLETNAAETLTGKKVILELKDEACLKMTPEQAKKLYLWLGKQITIFENKIRKIEISGEATESALSKALLRALQTKNK